MALRRGRGVLSGVGKIADRLRAWHDAAVKVSGLAMVTLEINEPSLRPWIECCIDRFGWDRVIFASNFPVDGIAGSYQDLLRAFDQVLKPDKPDQLEKFFAANAERIYRV